MLHKVPASLGAALRGVRAGFDQVASQQSPFRIAPNLIKLTSPAFDDAGSIPLRYTADGKGISPPLTWRGLPARTRAVALLVEDPDAPALEPDVHLLAWDLPPYPKGVPEGEFTSLSREDDETGLGGFRPAWIAPDPPSGHGPHLYVFQIFALSRPLGFDGRPTKAVFLRAVEGTVLAKGVLVGVHSSVQPIS